MNKKALIMFFGGLLLGYGLSPFVDQRFHIATTKEWESSDA